MKVYIVTDNAMIVGVYQTLQLAMSRHPAKWEKMPGSAEFYAIPFYAIALKDEYTGETVFAQTIEEHQVEKVIPNDYETF